MRCKTRPVDVYVLARATVTKPGRYANFPAGPLPPGGTGEILFGLKGFPGSPVRCLGHRVRIARGDRVGRRKRA
jgi:hypothetical protein